MRPCVWGPFHNGVAISSNGVSAREIVRAWGRILSGYQPNLSIEITKECPLRCPGCYAYGDQHLGADVTLRSLSDFKGDDLVSRFMALVDRHRPLHVSIVSGKSLGFACREQRLDSETILTALRHAIERGRDNDALHRRAAGY